MELKLNDIPVIASALKNASTKAITLLNNIIFDTPHDRSTRNKLRNFRGFSTDYNVAERQKKIKDSFSLADLIQVANILQIEICTDPDILCNNIFKSLSSIENLKEQINLNANSEDEQFSTEINTQESAIVQTHNDLNSSAFENSDAPIPPINHSVPEPRNFNFGFSLKDIADDIKKFDGTSGYPVNSFLETIDQTAILYNLTDLQTLIIAKKCLVGTARTFLNSISSITSWISLREILKEEFEETFTVAQIHKTLSERKMSPNENCFEYFIKMREIASKACIDEVSTCEHVINGLPNCPHKMLLYGCNSFSELKKKLLVFEKLYRENKPQLMFKNQTNTYTNRPDFSRKSFKINNPVSVQHPDFNRNNLTVLKCFQCGAKDHVASSCTFKEIRCFYCKNFGHKIATCPKKSRMQPASSHFNKPDPQIHQVTSYSTPTPSMTLPIYISDTCISALVDSGSQYTLLRQSIHQKLGSPMLQSTSLTLTGLGSINIQPLGFFHTTFKIQNTTFTSDIFVIQDNFLSVDAILGLNILRQGEFTFNKMGVKLIEKEDQSPNSNINFCVQAEPSIPCDDTLPFSNDSFAGIVQNSVLPDLSHITDNTIRTEINQLITSYKPTKIKSPGIEMNIVLSDNIPVHHRPRRLPQTEQKIVDAQIQTWLDEGIIKPSYSDYSSPVVLCKKKDNSNRLCIDYRQLNKKILRDRFPLPLIDDVIDRLENSTVFSKLDLKNGFFHVPINPNCTKFTSFVVPNGQYEFLFAPFGLCVSPNIFQRYIYAIFRPLMAQNIVVIYLDDFIIPAKTEIEALQKLKIVFQVASDHGLELNFKKCCFLQKKIEFLGYVFQNGTIQPSPHKTIAVQNFPVPTNVKHLQSFLGLTGYFRKFISHYSLIARPLTDLLRDNVPFHFGEIQQQAFQRLKDILSESPVLHIFRQGAKLEIHTDASSHGFGSVLLQQQEDGHFYPIHYMSRKTTPQQEKLSSYELEVLAIIESVKKFRTYLLGSKFVIVTDCEAFQKTIHKKHVTPKIARWSLILDEFQYEIVHRPGKLMPHVDALSRHAVYLITENSEVTSKIAAAQSQDEQIITLKTLCTADPNSEFFVRNDVLYKHHNGLELLVVPHDMQTQIVRDAHLNGHFSIDKTEHILKQSFYFPNMRKCVENVIQNCVQCILINKKRGKAEGFLHPIPKEDVPFGTFHLDFLGPLPSTNKQYNHILAVVDAFTKFLWLYPVKTTAAKEVILKLSLLQSTFGNPSRIITDKGPAFIAADFQDYCKENNIILRHITTGVPRGNGQIERMLQTVIPVLSKLSIHDPLKWYQHVAAVQRTLNSTVSSTTNQSPFELLVGVPLNHKQDSHIIKLLQEEYITSFMDQRETLRSIAKENICKMQETNKRNFNKHRKKPHLYKLGDMVAIARTQFGVGLKLRPRFHGPYQITKIKPNERYDVQKIGVHDGPNLTSTCADHMKPWTSVIT